MDKNIKKSKPKTDKSSHEQQLMVLVENLGDQIKLVAEGNLMLGEKMDAGFDKVWRKIDSLENDLGGRIDSLENDLGGRIDSLDGKINSVEKDMRGSFKTIIEYLSRIEDEIAEIKTGLKRLEEKKADKEALIVFEKRIAKIEREMEECKNLCKNQ